MKCQIVRARQPKHMLNPLCNQVGLYENIWDKFNIWNSQIINHNTNCHRLKREIFFFQDILEITVLDIMLVKDHQMSQLKRKK